MRKVPLNVTRLLGVVARYSCWPLAGYRCLGQPCLEGLLHFSPQICPSGCPAHSGSSVFVWEV